MAQTCSTILFLSLSTTDESSTSHPGCFTRDKVPYTQWVAPNICESSAWNLLHVTFLATYNFKVPPTFFGDSNAPAIQILDVEQSTLQLGRYGNTEQFPLLTFSSRKLQNMHSRPANLSTNSLLSLLLHAACQFPSFLGQGLFTMTQWHQP